MTGRVRPSQLHLLKKKKNREQQQHSALWASSLPRMESFFSEVPWCGPRDHPPTIPHHESSCNSQTLY